MTFEVIHIKHKLISDLQAVVKEKSKKFSPGERIAIKLHMGEWGNLFYIRPAYVRAIVDVLNEEGLKPFLFESPATYAGARDTCEKYYETAKKNGFTAETIGCPIIISDEGIEVDTSLGKVSVCKELVEADGMIVLSHFKGHGLTDYGAGVKNLGMGGFTKDSKAFMHANTGSFIENIENCTGCGLCVPACDYDLLEVLNDKIVMKKCFGCSGCYFVCPNGVIGIKNMPLAKYLAEVDTKLLAFFKEDKLLYINILMDIVKGCDCHAQGLSGESYELVAPNLGIVIGDNIVATDQASLDIVKEACPEFFKLHPTDEQWQTEEAEKLGLGSRDYQLTHY